MRSRASAVVIVLLTFGAVARAEDPPEAAATRWNWKSRVEVRANWRDSHASRFPLKFPFPPTFLPRGQTVGYLETVDAGKHAELSVAQVRLDLGYDRWFLAHTQFHLRDKYRRNPTSDDRKFDADELWIRFGEKPEILDRPERTSFFLQFGKAPKMERQPVRLLESYGLAATSFNRFEDVMVMTGGSIGRNLYWRVQASSGNPLYFRDPNALAGDNGIRELQQPFPDPRLKSGFPILYNTEVEGYFLKTGHVQLGEGVGYRWQNEAQTAGFDAIAFHYQRSLADRQQLSGTFYGGDLDLLDGPDFAGIVLPVTNRTKKETGGRIYAEWRGATAIAQYTKQSVAGLHREGYELETGYRRPFAFGPDVRGESLFQYVQPAVRASGLVNRFRGPRTFIAPSVWWNWTKIDYGLRVGFAHNIDLTAERARHHIASPLPVDEGETLVTLRIRM